MSRPWLPLTRCRPPLSRSVKTLTGGRLEADHRCHRIEVPRVPPAPATARTTVGRCRPHHQIPATPPPINPLSALQALLEIGSAGDWGDSLLVRVSGSRTAICVNTGWGVRPARRAKCEVSESVGSHVSHPQQVDTDIRDAGGLPANTLCHRASPCSRVRPARLHLSRSLGSVTASLGIAGRIAADAHLSGSATGCIQ
jgi:hypothetical protein